MYDLWLIYDGSLCNIKCLFKTTAAAQFPDFVRHERIITLKQWNPHPRFSWSWCCVVHNKIKKIINPVVHMLSRFTPGCWTNLIQLGITENQKCHFYIFFYCFIFSSNCYQTQNYESISPFAFRCDERCGKTGSKTCWPHLQPTCCYPVSVTRHEKKKPRVFQMLSDELKSIKLPPPPVFCATLSNLKATQTHSHTRKNLEPQPFVKTFIPNNTIVGYTETYFMIVFFVAYILSKKIPLNLTLFSMSFIKEALVFFFRKRPYPFPSQDFS